LITGLGNIGEEYQHTRHNIGFDILDAYARASNISFMDKRYASVAETRIKGRTLVLIKPSTYVNLSGKAVNYWLAKENVPLENLLVLVDDLALPLGSIRIRAKGSDGGHNGLLNINEVIGTQDYARLRFGIGSEFSRGGQVDFVLGRWSAEEDKLLTPRIEEALEAIKCFALSGLNVTMNRYNKR
jgi:peptidyl-tRNA hydrolase, PTH1 family